MKNFKPFFYRSPVLVRVVLVLSFVYFFIISIGLMGAAFSGFGEGFAQRLIEITSNPLVGLFIGILATSIVQSSSTVTSITVGMVSSGALTITNAIPIVMGANVGTTITCFVVALTHFNRREEFKRAISGAAVLVFFSIFSVCIFLPIEIWTGFLRKASILMVSVFEGFGGFSFISPLEIITRPITVFSRDFLIGIPFLPEKAAYFIMLLLALVLMFISLYFIVKIMRSLVVGRIELVLNNVFKSNVLIIIFFGFIATAFVQSSSITTSLMIPFVAVGILKVEIAFPMFLGAKLGTTTTTILASFATGNIAAITVAFAHFLFSFFGAFIFYPIKIIRSASLSLAYGLGNLTYRKRRYAVIFASFLFFIIPAALILIFNLLNK